MLQLSQATYKEDEVLERATEREYAHPTETLAARRGCRSYHPNPAARPKATDHLIECTEILNHTPTFRDSGGLPHSLFQTVPGQHRSKSSLETTTACAPDPAIVILGENG